ncbi:MAG: amidohydrolase [Bacteroidales bacterium]
MQQFTLGLIQTDILWEDISGNLARLYPRIVSAQGVCDLIIFPEMFTTGFSMHSATLAEPVDGFTISTLQAWADQTGIAFCGSFICRDGDKTYNRAFFITPMQRFFYDKHHLFRMGSEPLHFDAGKDACIVSYKGWNISLQVCYDLRFPVWCRNVNNNYDLQIFVASWPASRQSAWDILLRARAIENEAYVAGVNRVGSDGNGIEYRGGSVVADMKGEIIAQATPGEEGIIVCTLRKDLLNKFREKFPAWQDADSFEIKQV